MAFSKQHQVIDSSLSPFVFLFFGSALIPYLFMLSEPQDCVRRRSITSVAANPACPDEATAEKAVNEVWESCFSDTRPFDEVCMENLSLSFVPILNPRTHPWSPCRFIKAFRKFCLPHLANDDDAGSRTLNTSLPPPSPRQDLYPALENLFTIWDIPFSPHLL